VANSGGGETIFRDSSTAAESTITNNADNSGVGSNGGTLAFICAATAGSAHINNNGTSSSQHFGGSTAFDTTSDAGNAVIINNGADATTLASGGTTSFNEQSSADAATVIANGGTGSGGVILFLADSVGGTSRMEMFGNGSLDISLHNAPGLTVGSIEGSGKVFLGANNLKIGSNNLNTEFSGVISDAGPYTGKTGGSLTKIGTAILTLSGANTYTGGTTITEGTLLISNTSGSGTGTGAVALNSGTLGGSGTIAGAVMVGTGTGAGAMISPGTSVGTLAIQSALTLNSDARFDFELNTVSALADKIVANGVTINGATFSFTDIGSAHLALGTSFIIMDNTSTSRISGFFSNLADNATFTDNGNTYLVSYEGGTGNDLTITVVPEPPIWQLLCSATFIAFGGRKILPRLRSARSDGNGSYRRWRGYFL
jgi:autotransporter-associated beta strand protein